LIARGDIRRFRFATPDKRRPVLVLGRPDVLPSLDQVPVIELSTQARGLGWEVAFSPADGLPSACVAKPEWIRAVERAYRDLGSSTLPEARSPRDSCRAPGRPGLRTVSRAKRIAAFEELKASNLLPLVDALPELVTPASAALGVPSLTEPGEGVGQGWASESTIT
jgi:mRNA interferase MazF